jgi:hypothetical protein
LLEPLPSRPLVNVVVQVVDGAREKQSDFLSESTLNFRGKGGLQLKCEVAIRVKLSFVRGGCLFGVQAGAQDKSVQHVMEHTFNTIR